MAPIMDIIANGIYQVNDFIWQDNSNPSIEHYDRQYELKPELVDPSAIVGRLQPGDIKFKDIAGARGNWSGWQNYY